MLPPRSGQMCLVPGRWKQQIPPKLLNTYQTTRCHTPELINLDIHRYKNLRDYEDVLTGVVSPPNVVQRKENKE